MSETKAIFPLLFLTVDNSKQIVMQGKEAYFGLTGMVQGGSNLFASKFMTTSQTHMNSTWATSTYSLGQGCLDFAQKLHEKGLHFAEV